MKNVWRFLPSESTSLLLVRSDATLFGNRAMRAKLVVTIYHSFNISKKSPESMLLQNLRRKIFRDGLLIRAPENARKQRCTDVSNDMSHFLRGALVASKVIPTPTRADAAPSTKSRTSVSVGRTTMYFVVEIEGELKSSNVIMMSFVRDPRSP
jgi:hypothetical protein